MGERCTGHCCREIHQPISPGQLAAAAEGDRRGDLQYSWNNEAHWRLGEAAWLEEMLYDGREEAPGKWAYKCRFLMSNGDCAEYDKRPTMCSAFPYGKPCPYEGCTWDEGKHGDKP